MKNLTCRIQIFTDVEKEWIAFEMECEVPPGKAVRFKEEIKKAALGFCPVVNVSNILDRFNK